MSYIKGCEHSSAKKCRECLKTENRIRARKRLGIPLDQPLHTKPKSAGDRVTYNGLHCRLLAARGRAADYSCADCGTSAVHWSYDYTDPDPSVDQRHGFLYSIDLNRYQPRCRRCHKNLDNHHKKVA